MLDIFATHTMLAAIEQMNPLHTFLRDRYFPTNDATDVFSTEDVLVEYKDGKKKLAPFVSPRKGGVAILREGFSLVRYTPPYIAPKRTMTADDLKKIGFGEALYSKLTPAQRQGALMMKDFEELDEMISRREEAMAAETLLTNACVMKHITDDPTKYEEKQIQFYEGGSNPAQYTPDTEWDESGADIIGDIFAAAEMLTQKGLRASDLIVDSIVGSAILNDPAILKLLDNRNVNIGGVSPEELVVFGDSENDVPILKMVPNSVAVANAMPVAAEAARYHIGSCPDDAVADALFDIAESTRRGEMPSFMRQ